MKNLIFGANPLSLGRQPFLSDRSTTGVTPSDRAATELNVRDFGALGNGNDDAPGIQRAIDRALEQPDRHRGIIRLNSTQYTLSKSLNLGGTGLRFLGSGMGNSLPGTTILLADFIGSTLENSVIIRCNGNHQEVGFMEFQASPARIAATNLLAHAIYIEASDTSSANSWFGNYHDLFISEQPGDGILSIGQIWLSTYNRVQIHSCKGQGMRFDNGTLTARSNTDNPGEVALQNVMIHDCLGHGVLIGNDTGLVSSNRGFRFDIRNIDLYRNADAAGSRKTAAQFWAFWDTSSITNSAFDGTARDLTPETSRAMDIAGRAISIRNTRLLNVLNSPIKVLEYTFDSVVFKTQGITIEDIAVTTDTDVDPLVNIAAGITDVKVNIGTLQDMKATVATTLTAPLPKQSYIRTLIATQTKNNSTTFVDSGLTIPLLKRERIHFRYVLYFRGDATADIKFMLDAVKIGTTDTLSPAETINYVTVGGIRVDGGDTISEDLVNVSAGPKIIYGTAAASGIRVAEIIGDIRTNDSDTLGELRLYFAQEAAVVANTDLLVQSHVVYWR